MKYQTDYDGFIAKDGCLLCMLVTICEDFVGEDLSRSEFLDLVDDLHENHKTSYDPTRPVISSEKNLLLPGAFVWDHEAVGNATLRALETKFRLKYTGRLYMEHYLETHKEKYSRGTPVGAQRIIFQGITEKGNGHFFGPEHNPYRPASKIVDIKSIRYYRFGGL
jgi:hypothetical protein